MVAIIERNIGAEMDTTYEKRGEAREQAMSGFAPDEAAIEAAYSEGEDWERTALRNRVKVMLGGLFVTPSNYNGVISGRLDPEFRALEGNIFTQDELNARVQAAAADDIEKSRKHSAEWERNGQIGGHLTEKLSWTGEHYAPDRDPKEVCAIIRKVLKQGVKDGALPAPYDFRVSTQANENKWYASRQYYVRTYHNIGMVEDALSELFKPYQKCRVVPDNEGYMHPGGGPATHWNLAINIEAHSIRAKVKSAEYKELKQSSKDINLTPEQRIQRFNRMVELSCFADIDDMFRLGFSEHQVRGNFSDMLLSKDKRRMSDYIDHKVSELAA